MQNTTWVPNRVNSLLSCPVLPTTKRVPHNYILWWVTSRPQEPGLHRGSSHPISSGFPRDSAAQIGHDNCLKVCGTKPGGLYQIISQA